MDKEENPFDGIVFNARHIVEDWIERNSEAADLGYTMLRDLESSIDRELKKAIAKGSVK